MKQRAQGGVTTTKPPRAAATPREPAEEAVEALYAAEDAAEEAELAADAAEFEAEALAAVAARAPLPTMVSVEETEEAEEAEEEVAEDDGEEEEATDTKRGGRTGWKGAKQKLLAATLPRFLFLWRGLVAAGRTAEAADATAIVERIQRLVVAIAALPADFHPPEPARTGGGRRSRTGVGARVHLSADTQERWAPLYAPEVLRAACTVMTAVGKARKIRLANGDLVPIACNQVIVARRVEGTAASTLDSHV
jgi:hypothetical protein